MAEEGEGRRRGPLEVRGDDRADPAGDGDAIAQKGGPGGRTRAQADWRGGRAGGRLGGCSRPRETPQ